MVNVENPDFEGDGVDSVVSNPILIQKLSSWAIYWSSNEVHICIQNQTVVCQSEESKIIIKIHKVMSGNHSASVG